MSSAAETNPGQTPDEIASAYRASTSEHLKKSIVPVAVIALFGLVDRRIPSGWPSTVEEVAIWGYLLEYARQGYLAVRDIKNAGKADKMARSADNASPTQSP